MAPIQRHFRPALLRSRFSPERLLTFPPSTMRRVFPRANQLSVYARFDPSETHSDSDADADVVKKPAGEVGKTYRLQDVCKLDRTMYKNIEKCIQELVGNHLQTNVTISHQDQRALTSVLLQANTTFPVLKRYDNSWLTRDFIKLELKHRINESKKGVVKGSKSSSA